jgi:hypothetical protein
MVGTIKIHGPFPGAALTAGHWTTLIPIKFHKSSGLRGHSFAVLFPNWSSAFRDASSSGRLEVGIACTAGPRVAKVERSREPNVFSAILLIASVDGETVREQRYLTLFSAYESLIRNRDVDATAIRHSLAHPPHALRDPKIVRSLNQRFGGLHLNLRDYSHQKEFYRCMATLLCAMDIAIRAQLC